MFVCLFMCVCVDGGEHENVCMCVCVRVPTPCCGYCATSQGLLDWLEVDASALSPFLYKVICVLSICIISRPFTFLSLSGCLLISLPFPLNSHVPNRKDLLSLPSYAEWFVYYLFLWDAAFRRWARPYDFCAVIVLRFFVDGWQQLVGSFNCEDCFASFALRSDGAEVRGLFKSRGLFCERARMRLFRKRTPHK